MAKLTSLTQKELMTITGVSITTVRNMELKSVFVRARDGNWEAEVCIKNYIDYLKKRHGTSGEVGMEDRDPDTEFRKQKARQARMQADAMEGRLIDVGDVARQWESHIYAAKSKLMALPDKLVAELMPLLREDSRIEELRDPATRMISEALEELTKDPELDEDDGDDDEEAGTDD